MKKLKKGLWLGLAVILTTITLINVPAASPEWTRTEEEWIKLRDNLIEYEEIEDLIHEYNLTVQNNLTDYREFVQEYGRSNDSIADSYRKAAQDLYDLMSYENNASSLIADLNIEMQAKQLLENADTTVEDSTVLWLSYQQIEKNLVVTAKSYMISYYRSLLELEEGQNRARQLELQYEQAILLHSVGMATWIEVMTALENLQSAQTSLLDLEMNIENIYKTLIIMLGWNYEDNPELAQLPDLDLTQIFQSGPEQDKPTALENNYTLQMNQRKLEYAKANATRETLERTIKNNERQIMADLSYAYQGLLSAMSSYEQTQADLAYEKQTLEQMEIRYQAGVATRWECQDQEYNYLNQELAVHKAYLNLFQAWENYNWVLKGLANAE